MCIRQHDVRTMDTWYIYIHYFPTNIYTAYHRGGRGGGGYSLYDGWYICAAVLTPFFDPLGTKLDLFGVFFLIHQHKNDLLGTNPRKIRSFWPQNTKFPSIFLGPIFSGPRHTPSNFRTGLITSVSPTNATRRSGFRVTPILKAPPVTGIAGQTWYETQF